MNKSVKVIVINQDDISTYPNNQQTCIGVQKDGNFVNIISYINAETKIVCTFTYDKNNEMCKNLNEPFEKSNIIAWIETPTENTEDNGWSRGLPVPNKLNDKTINTYLTLDKLGNIKILSYVEDDDKKSCWSHLGSYFENGKFKYYLSEIKEANNIDVDFWCSLPKYK